MHRSEEEQLVDLVIGEAVISLLDSSAAITGAALVARLTQMAAASRDPARSAAIHAALTEARRRVPSAEAEAARAQDAAGPDALPPKGTRRH